MTEGNTFPKLHNAVWPGVVGKGEEGEPPIDLDTMLDLTAAAEVDGVKFDGVDLFLFDPHVSIDSDRRRPRRGWPTRSARAGWWSARSSRRSGRRPAAARRWATTRTASSFSTQVRKGCRIAEQLRELGIRPYGVVRIDSACGAGRLGGKIPKATRSGSPTPSARPATSPRNYGERLAAEGEICWGGMHSWQRDGRAAGSGRPPETLGFQADMAHTLLYMLGYNAPEDRILPADFDWNDTAALDAAYKQAHRRAAALDDRLPRRPERRHGVRLRLARQDRPPLPAQRSQRQARHRQVRRLLAARRQRQADQDASSTSAGTAACSPTTR